MWTSKIVRTWPTRTSVTTRSRCARSSPSKTTLDPILADQSGGNPRREIAGGFLLRATTRNEDKHGRLSSTCHRTVKLARLVPAVAALHECLQKYNGRHATSQKPQHRPQPMPMSDSGDKGRVQSRPSFPRSSTAKT